ncbi:MAG: ECF transporter S component [Clostridia bacterium]|nr:ECF transporter S component [Clostridia bacterium]
MKNRVQWICVTAVGVALFVALSLCLQVPVFENYYLCLGYAAMMVYCCFFGTLSGTLTGVLGVVLYCLLISGLRGMPGWALGNAVIGVVMGLTFHVTKKMKRRAVQIAVQIAAVAVSVTAGILVVKSLTESLLYGQPFAVRTAKNVYAWAADAVMMIASLPVCHMLEGPVKKIFPNLEGEQTGNE